MADDAKDRQLALMEDPGGDKGPNEAGPGAERTKCRWTVGEITILIERLADGQDIHLIAAFLARSLPGVRRTIARLMDEEADDGVLAIGLLADTTKATLAEVRRKGKIEKSARARRKTVGAAAPLAHLQAHVEAIERAQMTDRQLSLFLLGVEIGVGSIPATAIEGAPIAEAERAKVMRIARDVAVAKPAQATIGLFNEKTHTFRTVTDDYGALVELEPDEIVIPLEPTMVPQDRPLPDPADNCTGGGLSQ